jgi:hypothetical protein
MSERYLEQQYNRSYRSVEAYKSDSDGFFMVCKLYFDERSLEYRLNVYPDYVLNICRSKGNPFNGMHFNRVPCTTMPQHWASLKYLASLPDKHYEMFSNEDDTVSIRNFLNPTDHAVNIARDYLTLLASRNHTDSIPILDYKPTIRQRNLRRELNILKQIKFFSLGSADDTLPKLASSITLKSTKYPLSEDLLEGTEYSYKFISYDQLSRTPLAKRATRELFISRNPLYRSIIISDMPDDVYSPIMSIDSLLELSYQDIHKASTINKNHALELTHREDSIVSKRQRDIDEELSKNRPQQQNQELKNRFDPGTDESEIIISSKDVSDTSWVYAGRFKSLKVPVKFAKDSIYQPQGKQFIRESLPERQASTGNYIRGRVKFKVNKGITDAEEHWTIKDVAPIGHGNYQYVWLKVYNRRKNLKNKCFGWLSRTKKRSK